MGESLRHRGPDGEGVFYYSPTAGIRLGAGADPAEPPADAGAGFVHRRLKILDLSRAADQPMAADGVVLVFNGEIYNYRELRRELEGEGAVFSSTGDTEVALKSYLAWGNDCFRRFNGMWAMAIFDQRTQSAGLCRDRVGIKPLYYARPKGDFVFASEIKALLRHPGVGRAPNERTVARYLGFGIADDGGETFFKDVFRFPAAHWAEVRLDVPAALPVFRRYWRLGTGAFEGDDGAAVERFRALFDDAVTSHHQGDVPSGNCLSGGLDSSAIVCWAAARKGSSALSHHTWKSFGFAPGDESLSERPFMEAAAKAAGADLAVVTLDAAGFESALPGILAAHDEPVGSPSACAQWLVFRRAAEAGIRVMLDGQGADETLGGYMGYLLTMARGALARGRFGEFLERRENYRRTVEEFPLTVPRMLADAFLPAWVRRRMMARRGPAFRAMAPGLAGLARYDGPADMAPRHDLGATLAADVEARTLPALLRYEDTNSMAFSIEARVPFLDHRLVEFAFSLPDRLKIDGSARKSILNKAMNGTVPEAIRARTNKIGFQADPRWMSAYAARHRDEIVDNATDHERAWFNGPAVRRLLEQGQQSDALAAPRWRVINVKHWIRSL